jgi:F-type H+-transporting ATPase subunit b
MHINWWTLALQTVNVLVLVWILARFFFRPIADIVARRQEQANKVLADAEADRRIAAKEKAEAEQARPQLAAEHERMIAAARRDAEQERARMLKEAGDEVGKLRADSEAAIGRDRAAMERALIDHVRDLSIEIAQRLLRRVSPDAGFDFFLKGLCDQAGKLAPRMQAAFTSAARPGEPVELLTAAPLSKEQMQHVRSALEQAFGQPLALTFRSDPAVIAGVELQTLHASIRSSWREDFDKIRKELSFADQPT